jgi:hypothetical protein
MSTSGNDRTPGEQETDSKQHGDPLLSTVEGEPEQGSRQGFDLSDEDEKGTQE